MAVEFKDYYSILGVPRDASEADIKKAFRKLARVHHPDVAKDKGGAEEKFKDINEAYEVLGDPEKRRKYDQLGSQWREGGDFEAPPGWQRRTWTTGQGPEGFEFHFGGTGFSDFFEQFFGGGAGGRTPFSGAGPDMFHGFQNQTRQRRGSDVEGDILITLDEVMHGAVRPITLQTVNPRTGQAETHSFQVRIPPGAPEDQRIRVPGKGAEGQGGGAPGDLYLRVHYAAHPDLRARGADVYHDLAVAPWEAVLGTTVTVRTLDGAINLRIPPNTDNGAQFRVPGHGLPKGKTGRRGDFFVVVSVQVPPAATADERELWEKLRQTSRFNPRD